MSWKSAFMFKVDTGAKAISFFVNSLFLMRRMTYGKLVYMGSKARGYIGLVKNKSDFSMELSFSSDSINGI